MEAPSPAALSHSTCKKANRSVPLSDHKGFGLGDEDGTKGISVVLEEVGQVAGQGNGIDHCR